MRRWFLAFFVTAIFFFTAVAFISSQVRFPIILPGQELRTKFYDYAGITHAHTILSTGSGTLGDLTSAAYHADCQFLIITDLNPETRPENVEGYRDDVLVVWAGEYSFLGGHLLAYNLPRSDKVMGIGGVGGLGQAQIFFNDLLDKMPKSVSDGFLVAAHPFLPQHSWENLKLPGLTGMEVINVNSLWHTQISLNKMSLLWSILILPFNPDLAFLRLYVEPNRELSAWDDILNRKNFVGFSGSDATANAIPLPERSFKFPSYTQSFRLTKDHVLLKSELTGSYAEDREKIMDALAHGSFYFSLDLLGNPSGFYFVAQQRHQEFLLGRTLSLSGGPVNLVADLGRDIAIPHEIVLLRNGQKIAGSNTSRLNYEVTEPGAYRVIVRVIPTLPIPDGKKWFTWIFSNAIRVE